MNDVCIYVCVLHIDLIIVKLVVLFFYLLQSKYFQLVALKSAWTYYNPMFIDKKFSLTDEKFLGIYNWRFILESIYALLNNCFLPYDRFG